MKTRTSRNTMRPAGRRTSEIALLATRIRLAMEYLTQVQGWSLAEIEKLTGEGDEALHKNSLMKIKDLERRYAIRKPSGGGRTHWVEAPDQSRRPPDGRSQWMWNPQIDTFEKMEGILEKARELGFEDSLARHAA
jgi:hypothetical protein